MAAEPQRGFDPERFGALVARVERLESLRQRALDLVPFSATLTIMLVIVLQLVNLTSRVGNVEYDVRDLSRRVEQQGNDTATLKTDVATLKTDVATLKTEFGLMRAQLDAIARKLDARP